MRTRFVPTLLSAGFLCAVSLSTYASGVSKVDAAHAPSASALRAAAATTATTSRSTSPSEFFANPDRAYPPSCLQSPLQLHLWQNDPNRVQTTVSLSGDLYVGGAEAAYLENDTVTVFRVPCSSGTSALLLEIDRPANLEGNTTTYPVFPLVGVYVSTTDVAAVRTPRDPNTFYSDTIAGVPLYNSSVFVIENFYNAGFDVNYNPAVSIYVGNLLSTTDPNFDAQVFNVAAYNPSAYTANSQPLPITGYESGNFFDTSHSGEGIQVEVGDINTTTHVITIAWYTFDDSGIPYWLYGVATLPIGATSVAVPLSYGSNGGFAGNFGNATFAAWGTITVNFPDCNTMKFTYAGNAGLPTVVPTGSGSKTWTRLTQLNGLTCQ